MSRRSTGWGNRRVLFTVHHDKFESAFEFGLWRRYAHSETTPLALVWTCVLALALAGAVLGILLDAVL